MLFLLHFAAVIRVLIDTNEALSFIRNHWGIEINLHWCLDVSFNEDNACCQRDNATINMNLLRKFALNILTLDKEKKSMTAMFRRCMNPHQPIKILRKFYDA